MSLNRAIKALRGSESQQIFATRMGISIRSLANYEKDRIPGKTVLTDLVVLARAAGREDLASDFLTALWSGPLLPGFTCEQTAWALVIADLVEAKHLPGGLSRWNKLRSQISEWVGDIEAHSKRVPLALASLSDKASGHLLAAEKLHATQPVH